MLAYGPSVLPVFLVAVVVVFAIFGFGAFMRAYRDHSHQRRSQL